MIRSFLSLFIIFVVSTGTVAEQLIPMHKDELDRLGIELLKPSLQATISGTPLQARVIIPPGKEFLISPTEPARLNSILVSPGEAVKKGQPLITITSPALLEMQRDLLHANATLKLAENRMTRDQRLSDEGLIATSRLETTRADYELARVHFNQCSSELRLNGLSGPEINQLKESGELQKAIHLRAPATGTVLTVSGILGSALEPGDTVIRMADLSELMMEIQLTGNQLARLQTGQQVTVEGRETAAQITTLGASVDPVTQTAIARATVTSESHQLRPGEVVMARVQTNSPSQPAIPRNAIIRSDDQHYVFVKVDQGFDIRQIIVASYSGDSATIEAGLTGEESIAVTGIAALKGAWLGLGEDE